MGEGLAGALRVGRQALRAAKTPTSSLRPPTACAQLQVPSLKSIDLCMLPRQVATGGEDACFISEAVHGAICVADGVSSWSEDGVDPGEYSRTLVQVGAVVACGVSTGGVEASG